MQKAAAVPGASTKQQRIWRRSRTGEGCEKGTRQGRSKDARHLSHDADPSENPSALIASECAPQRRNAKKIGRLFRPQNAGNGTGVPLANVRSPFFMKTIDQAEKQAFQNSEG